MYIDCGMGAAGDMLMAALLELLPDKHAFIQKINSVGIKNTVILAKPSVKCGISGTHISVLVNGTVEESLDDAHSHHEDFEFIGRHMGLHEICHIISSLSLPQKVKDDAIAVYKLLAEAEAAVHGKEPDTVHFHEVGGYDAIADIVGVCMLMYELSPETVIVSPVNAGSGSVRCVHGILPVPAPATVNLLKGIPFYTSDIKGELCTPTGAALLKYFGSSFGNMSEMRVEKIGYGMGSKDFEAANCLRVFLGEIEKSNKTNDKAVLLSCCLDDMTGEAVAFACETLLENGALDVYCEQIMMKKGRPGIKLNCLCSPDMANTFAALILKHTTTFGVRRIDCHRYILSRDFQETDTLYGKIRIKTGSGFGVTKAKPEYADIAQAARESDTSLFTVESGLNLGKFYMKDEK